jgi:hypothetical protein
MYLRPFSSQKDNIIDTINEIIFSIFSIILIGLNKEKDWNDALVRTFMYLVLGNTLIIFFILTVALVIQVKKNGCKCKSKPENSVQDLPKTMIILNPATMQQARNLNPTFITNNEQSHVLNNSRLGMYNDSSINPNIIKVNDGSNIKRVPANIVTPPQPISNSKTLIDYLKKQAELDV